MFVDHGAVGVNKLEYERRPEPSILPIRLGPRPVALAGREGLLADLDARLAGVGAQPGPRVAVLCGLGGAGKTSVAVEYAHRHVAEVGVCWQFAAEDPTVLAAEFAELAAQLGTRDLIDARNPVASVHGVLARAETGWLLVFDNVTDRASVQPFLPPAGRGRVLITTQNQHWPPSLALDVPILDVEVAAGFLVSRTGDADRRTAWELAGALGGLPLALEQAAAYMQASGTTLARYLELFRTRQADLLARGEAAGHPLDVAATLGLALSRLEGDVPEAAGLLRLLAFLAPEPVPLGLLMGRYIRPGQLGQEPTAALGPVLGDEVAARDAVAALRRYSLAVPSGDRLVQVHRLVQAVTRAQLSSQEADQWKQTAAALTEAAVPLDDGLLPTTWQACSLLLPHALTVLSMTSHGSWQVALSLGFSGSYAAARDLFELIVDAHMAEYGPEYADTLTAQVGLALWTANAGDPADARDQLAPLLPVLRRILGREHLQTLIARGYVASWTGRAGDPAGACDQFADLLPVMRRVLGPEHPETLVSSFNAAYFAGNVGDASAYDQYAALVPVMRRVLGPEHPNTLTALGHLASWTGRAGDPAGARDQLTALLTVRERVLGPEHPDTLITRHNLASWTGRAGDPAGARDQLTALLTVCERVLGPENPVTLDVRDDLASWAGNAEGAG
jgi:hypothetical protein